MGSRDAEAACTCRKSAIMFRQPPFSTRPSTVHTGSNIRPWSYHSHPYRDEHLRPIYKLIRRRTQTPEGRYASGPTILCTQGGLVLHGTASITQRMRGPARESHCSLKAVSCATISLLISYTAAE